MLNTVQFLLQKVAAANRAYDEIDKNTGAGFNVFRISGIGSREVNICRVLRELLDPEGSHGRGALYLDLFNKIVLRMNIPYGDLCRANVVTEYIIAQDRRIDLYIQAGDYFIPIEVKIYAKDQKNQCRDYYPYARNSNLYYLTRYGSSPTEFSTNAEKACDEEAKNLTRIEEGYVEITNISFSEHILAWLTACLKQEETICVAPVRETLLQLMTVIRGFTNQLEDKRGMEIQQIITSSSENMRAAVDTARVINKCKYDMIVKLFEALEKELAPILTPRKISKDYIEQASTFYDQKNSTFPGISWIGNCEEKCFRIEINYRLYAGFYALRDGTLKGDEQLAKSYNMPDSDSYWCYLPRANENDSPNFKEPNTVFFNLFDEVFFNDFIHECVERIRLIFMLS
ncbi:MAG: hypothetical protein BWY11_02308 [Firmicutes bacterium ADurb.Bin182]|nr:MAG: hypothetical protein BWY11_02308 [Firmicutes bacterium ADurb.Bin182]